MRALYSLIFFAIILSGCAGEDKMSADSTPPAKVFLIEHLGDSGDYIGGQLQNYYDNSDLENNGIDTVPGGNWIQIQWQHPLDDDIYSINIYRFSLEDYNDYVANQEAYGDDYQYAQQIAQVSYSNNDYYIDKSSNLLDKILFYYIGLEDEAGNETVSDTLGYRLIDKPILLNPSEVVINPDEMLFSWSLDSDQLSSESRLLLFSENHKILWVYSPLEFEDTEELYFGDELNSQQLIWRVDVKSTINYYEIDDKTYTVYSGAESNEHSFYLQR